ncbi:MAG: hypothetical protein GX786_10675, partial [Clostridiales bacterium]|nr:hypothetical protein [Clostridiales bacterium]
MYQIKNIPFPLEGTIEELKKLIGKKIKVPVEQIKEFTILKKSVDARDK